MTTGDKIRGALKGAGFSTERTSLCQSTDGRDCRVLIFPFSQCRLFYEGTTNVGGLARVRTLGGKIAPELAYSKDMLQVAKKGWSH
jgi:hypothetical protein